MNCTKCGALLMEGTKFCSQCGASVIQEIFCPSCGAKLSSDQIFCTSCGMKLSGNVPRETVYSGQPIKQENSISKGSGKLLRKMSGITKFLGEPTVGLANKVGTLTIYDNRVEFVRKGALTLAGTISALAKSEAETYYFSDVTDISTGSYLAIYTTLVLKLKNGNKVSFCPSIPVSKDMETVVNLLTHYL